MAEWIGVGGFAIAGLTLLLTHLERRHARSETYRTVVYQRQLDAITAVAGQMAVVQDEVLAIRSGDKPGPNLWPQLAALRRTISEQEHLLPGRTVGVLMDYMVHTSLFSALGVPRFADNNEQGQSLIDDWIGRHAQVLEQMRRDLGVDPLGEKTRELIGLWSADRPS